MNILRPLPKEELNNFFSEHSLNVIQYYMNTSLFTQPTENLPLQIPNEHLEQWFIRALEVESVGAGSYPIDILKPKKWGAEVRILSCKIDQNSNLTNKDSGEISLSQKFKSTGMSLDDMFRQEQYQEIIDDYISIWKEKLLNVRVDKKIERIYYFFFLRGSKKESYICAFEANIDGVNPKTITQRDKNSEIKQSIFLNGVIDERYGNSKIYKSKKRLELRLRPKNLLEDGFLITLPIERPSKEDMHQLVQNKEERDVYIKNKLTISKIKISKKVKLELYKALEKEQGAFPSDDKWMDFLDEIWNLRTLPSEDVRCANAYEDIVQHTINNYDYELEYLFLQKLKLLESNKIFIKFLNTLVHPNFRENSDEIISLVFFINSYIEKENLVLVLDSYDEYEVPIYKIAKQENVPTYNDLVKNQIPFFFQKGLSGYINNVEASIRPKDIPSFVLLLDSGWNDYTFQTKYYLFYCHEDGIENIGDIKIGNEDNSVDGFIPEDFVDLNDSYFSLGQTYEFYKKLKELMGIKFESVLYALKDVAFFPNIYERFENNDVFKTSLIRYDEVEQLSRVVKYKLYGFDLNHLYDFKYNFLPKYSTDAVDIEFNFTNNLDFPNRIYAVIGKNGTGKTQFITSLPLSISKKENDKFSPRTPMFSKVIAVSYSIFDNFEKPKSTSSFNYIYCGLLDNKGELLSDRQQLLRFHKTWKKIVELNRTYEWYAVLNNFIDTTVLNEFCIINNDEFCEINRQEFNKLRRNFSSGQTILLYIMTEIIANIRRDALLLFDEPETHLHPNAISQLMNVIYDLVNKFKSYCIITTHSPLIVQEVLSKNVKIIERHENLVSVRQIGIESFGANLTTLTEEVFGNKEIQKHYKKIINKMISHGKSYNDIIEILEREGFPLSINILLYIKSQLV